MTSAQLEAEMESSSPAPEPEPSPEPVSEPEVKTETTSDQEGPPSHSARRGEWETYARTVGVDPTDLTKAEIISKVEGA